MKLDITRLPVDAAVVGFLIVVLAITFFLAFEWLDDDGEAAPVASETPTGEPTPGGESPTPGGGEEIAISMGDNFFDPEEVTLTAGSSTTFNITNDGTAIHNMRIAGEDGEYDTDDDTVSDPDIVPGGETATLAWDAPTAAGEIDFRCDFHPTEMVGTITVE